MNICKRLMLAATAVIGLAACNQLPVTATATATKERECKIGYFQIWNTPDVRASVAGMSGSEESDWGWDNRRTLQSTSFQVIMTIFRTEAGGEDQVLWRQFSTNPMAVMEGESAPDCSIASLPGSKLCWRVMSNGMPIEIGGIVTHHRDDDSFSTCTMRHASFFAGNPANPNYGTLLRIGTKRRE